MNERELRRALLTLRSAGALEIRHVYGEINSLWKAREAVRKFLKGNSISTAPDVKIADPEPVDVMTKSIREQIEGPGADSR